MHRHERLKAEHCADAIRGFFDVEGESAFPG